MQQMNINLSQSIDMNQLTIIEDPVIILQPSGHIYYCNEEFLGMAGTSSQNIYSRHIFDFIHREDAQPLLDIILSLMTTPSQYKIECTLRIKLSDGEALSTTAVIKLVRRQSQVIGIKIEMKAIH